MEHFIKLTDVFLIAYLDRLTEVVHYGSEYFDRISILLVTSGH